MIKLLKIGFLFLSISQFGFAFLFGQSKNEPYSIEELMAGKSAIILNEDLEINIYGKERNATDDNAAGYRSFRIRRILTVKILNPDGIRIFNHFVLPESFDPTFIAHGSDVKNLGTYYSAYKINQFKVSVKREKKKAFSPKLTKKTRSRESFNIDNLYDYSQNVYTAGDVRVGDEVTLTYDLEIPFQENYSRFASYRIFFHDSIPKLKYKLTITHHESIDIELYEKNGAKASRHFLSDGIVSRSWLYENLPGSIKEAGSRPYTELPHLCWVINFYKYYVHNSTGEKNIPHYAIIASLKSPELADIITSIQIGSKSKQFASFSNAYDKFSGGKPVDYQTIKRIHQEIVENFKYDNDLEFYRRNDMRTERLGEYFENGVLRDKSRYNMYYALMTSARQNFYSVFLIDKRSGEFSDEYFLPAFDNDNLLATYLGDREYDLILPKRHAFGWYYNEIPFYWEDCKSKLVHITDYATYKKEIKQNIANYVTPSNDSKDNTRIVELRSMVDLDLDTIHFKGQVNLSGQFSTMCRQAYQNGYKDPSVSQLYNKPVWSLIGEEKNVVSENHVSSPAYPFAAEYGIQFKVGSKVEKKNETYEIDLNNWFPHIIPHVRSVENRFLTYYSDFLGADHFVYEVQFTRPVALENGTDIELKNNYADYRFVVSQESPMIIKISSYFKVLNQSVDSQDFEEVNDIFKEIDKANKFLLKVK